jgi:hypothetical protein
MEKNKNDKSHLTMAGQGPKKTSNGTDKTSNTDKSETDAMNSTDEKKDTKTVMSRINKSKAKA